MATFQAAFNEELLLIRGGAGTGGDPDVAYGGCTGDAAQADDGAEPFVVNSSHDLTGLALSGGGIRSATFNLGLLQGLAERKLAKKSETDRSLLDLFDYLSTVSGGGYIGSFWSGWRARNPKGPLFPNDRSEGTDNVRSEPDPVRHLREFSRFLAPRWGLFEIETWQFFGGALSAILPALVVSFSVLALVIWYVLIVSANGMGGNQVISIWNYPLPCVTYLALALAVIGVSTFGVMWRFERQTEALNRENDDSYTWLYWLVAVFSTAFAMGGDWWLLHGIRSWGYFELMPGLGQTFNERVRFLSPAICWISVMLVLIVIRAVASRAVVDPRKGFFRYAIDRVIARLLGLAVFWTAMILFIFAAFILWTRNPVVVGWWTALVGGGSGGIFGYIQKILSRQPNRAKGGLRTYAERYALPLLAMGAVVAAALGVACLVFTLIEKGHAAAGVGVPLAVVLAALVLYNPNEIGLHPIYRSRLSRAYLGASNAKASNAARNRQSTERPGDDLPLQELPATRPIHLVCCAANDLAGDHLANLSRGARSATLSRFGFTLANRYQKWEEAPAKVTLATAMTASAAAFNSNMGSLSMDLGAAATFLMASLNLRLGYWYHFSKVRHFFPGCDLFFEMFSRTNSGARSSSIHLSDGGHFENLAVYELLRRRCRYILASDCGADSQAAFDDVGNALRRAREDFGVEVKIDLACLKPDEKGLSRQHVAVGDITYPDGQKGILVLFKPTIVGDEPGDVLQYRTRNTSFPHESTGDQFYDEKQWESYRRLGLHAARIAFRFLDNQDVTDLIASQVFGSVREEWQPTPPTLPDQLMARAAELQAIERQVVTLGNENLLRDLYPELKWDENAKHTNDLDTKKLAALVPLFAQVLQLMTDVYVSCHLGQYGDHPLNIAWVNWFARWATTPAFRDLWPLLSPMFNPNMRRYFEDLFELRSAGSPRWSEGQVVESESGQGLAFELWKAVHPGKDRSGYKTLLFRVTVREGWAVDVALLFFKEENGVKVWTERWTDPDFFVPPSLWQAGIGKAFLEKIRDFLDKSGPGIARIDDDPSRRGEVSDHVQMYSEAGFKRMGADGGVIEMRRDRKK